MSQEPNNAAGLLNYFRHSPFERKALEQIQAATGDFNESAEAHAEVLYHFAKSRMVPLREALKAQLDAVEEREASLQHLSREECQLQIDREFSFIDYETALQVGKKVAASLNRQPEIREEGYRLFAEKLTRNEEEELRKQRENQIFFLSKQPFPTTASTRLNLIRLGVPDEALPFKEPFIPKIREIEKTPRTPAFAKIAQSFKRRIDGIIDSIAEHDTPEQGGLQH